jgi:hypothetical protein
MAKAKKEPKPRADKYEEKLKIHGTFEEAMKVVFKDADRKLKEKKK